MVAHTHTIHVTIIKHFVLFLKKIYICQYLILVYGYNQNPYNQYGAYGSNQYGMYGSNQYPYYGSSQYNTLGSQYGYNQGKNFMNRVSRTK